MKKWSEQKTAYAYLTPALLFMLALVIYPIIYSLYLSFNEVDFQAMGISYNFVGFGNYIRLFNDFRFGQFFSQTATFTVLRVTGSFVFGLGIAMLVADAGWWSKIFKAVFLIPWALSDVVNGLMWQWMYNSEYGIINEVLVQLGLIDSYVGWLSSMDNALYAIIFGDVWKTVPFVSLMFLAALQNIPRSLYEAAVVDGANAVQKFLFVTIPSIKPVIMVVFVIQTMWALKAFDLIWVLTKGGPVNTTTIFSVYAYRQSFMYWRMGYGAAIAYFITFVTLILTWIYIKSLREED